MSRGVLNSRFLSIQSFPSLLQRFRWNLIKSYERVDNELLRVFRQKIKINQENYTINDQESMKNEDLFDEFVGLDIIQNKDGSELEEFIKDNNILIKPLVIDSIKEKNASKFRKLLELKAIREEDAEDYLKLIYQCCNDNCVKLLPCESHLEFFQSLLSQAELAEESVKILQKFCQGNAFYTHLMMEYVEMKKVGITQYDKEKLFQLLHDLKEKEFCEELDEKYKIACRSLTQNGFTLLQIACKNGMSQCVRKLIEEMGLSVDKTPINPIRPIEYACENGHSTVLKILIKNQADLNVKPQKQVTLLHLTAQAPRHSETHAECLKILLEHIKNQIEETDDFGRTPLHCAAIYKNESCIFELLNNGADIYRSDINDEKLLADIPKKTLRKYLDSKVEIADKESPLDKAEIIEISENEQDEALEPLCYNNCRKRPNLNDSRKSRSITFNYENFVVEKNGEIRFPTNNLLQMIKIKKFRPLMTHPMFSTIVCCKWYKIRTFFYFYLFIYAAFCVAYTSYIITTESTVKNLYKLIQNALARKVLNTFASNMIQVTFMALIGLLTFIEVMAMASIKRRYFKSLDNILKPIVISLALITLWFQYFKRYDLYYPEISSVSVLLIWFQLFLTLGKHPEVTLYVSTFISAAKVLLKFLLIHFVLLIGFALSFHTLFRNSDKENKFTNWFNALFKTIVMLTSEFDASEIPFDNYAGISHVIFVVYIFLIAIALVNLMIGLVGTEAKKIEDDPYLYRNLSQVEIISYFEDTAFDFFYYVRRLFDCVCGREKKKKDAGKIVIINAKNYTIERYFESFEQVPNKNAQVNWILFPKWLDRLLDKYCSYRIDSGVVKECMKIFDSRKFGDLKKNNLNLNDINWIEKLMNDKMESLQNELVKKLCECLRSHEKSVF